MNKMFWTFMPFYNDWIDSSGTHKYTNFIKYVFKLLYIILSRFNNIALGRGRLETAWMANERKRLNIILHLNSCFIICSGSQGVPVANMCPQSSAHGEKLRWWGYQVNLWGAWGVGRKMTLQGVKQNITKDQIWPKYLQSLILPSEHLKKCEIF